MANSNVIGKFTDELEQATGEVATEVKDSVGQMIEQGVQSISGKQPTPQQIQQKQQEDQQQLIQARKTIKWHEDIQTAQKKVQQEDKQKADLRKQQQQEEEERKRRLAEEQKRRVIISPAKRTPQIPGQPAPVEEEEIARSRQETGKGHGIGG